MSLQLTWLGHATWLLQTSNHKILIDPFIGDNPSSTVSVGEIDADHILLTHGHFDHVADAAEIANRCNAMLVANYEIATWFAEKHGVKNTLGMNLGGAATLPFGKVKMTLAWHSSQLPDGSYGGNPGGYIVEIDSKKLYFAGDTALFTDMVLIGSTGLDAAVLPIGDLFTMGPEDSIEATKLLKPKMVIPAHYNTWPPIEQDAAAWSKLVEQKTSAKPVVPQVGTPIDL